MSTLRNSSSSKLTPENKPSTTTMQRRRPIRTVVLFASVSFVVVTHSIMKQRQSLLMIRRASEMPSIQDNDMRNDPQPHADNGIAQKVDPTMNTTTALLVENTQRELLPINSEESQHNEVSQTVAPPSDAESVGGDDNHAEHPPTDGVEKAQADERQSSPTDTESGNGKDNHAAHPPADVEEDAQAVESQSVAPPSGGEDNHAAHPLTDGKVDAQAKENHSEPPPADTVLVGGVENPLEHSPIDAESVGQIEENSSETQHTSTSPAVIQWDGFGPIENAVYGYFFGDNNFCKAIDNARKEANDTALPITLNVTFGCQNQFWWASFGTGNYITAFYGMRMAYQIYDNVGLHINCHDADQTKKDLILPWMTGYFPPREPNTKTRFPDISREQACGDEASTPMALMYREIRHDFRSMAIGLVGVPSPDHPSAAFAEKYLWNQQADGDELIPSQLFLANHDRNAEPAFPRGSVELDDAVIHFRCGDLMDSEHPMFGFLKFSGFEKYISPEARTIGIITQPFQLDAGSQSRTADQSSTMHDRCKITVMALVDYIQERHPNSRITVHNGPGETIALSYARMIMANQTIAGISTFGVFPVMSTFGEGYLRNPVHPNRAFPNAWTRNPPIDTLIDTLTIIEEHEQIMTYEIKKLWETEGEQGVLAWFRDDTLSVQR